QDVIDSPLCYPATAELLPEACRAQSVSRMVRSMATVGGESVSAARDSEVAAALLALNALYVGASTEAIPEIPALRFLPGPAEVPARAGCAGRGGARAAGRGALRAPAAGGRRGRLLRGRHLRPRTHRADRPRDRAGSRAGGGVAAGRHGSGRRRPRALRLA